MTPRISIVIPTRNRAPLLSRLLDSLSHLSYSKWEAIVVDDGSSDDTAAVAEEYRKRGLPLTYLWQPWRRMGAARNRGIAAASGDILAFTDDDCIVDPGWLDAIARAFDAHPEALGVQGKTVTDRAAMTPFTRQVEQLEGGQPYRTCNIAYRASIVCELGGFDALLIRGEDVVMGMRVVERGPIVFAADAIVCHPPRPKAWADRRAWRTLLESEVHFKRTYPQYAAARSPTLSVQKAGHVVSRWVLLPVRRYWRWHWAYFRREPWAYLRHVPSMVREKLALFSLLPYFAREWIAPHRPVPSSPGPRPPEETRGVRGASPLLSVVVPTRNRAALLPGVLAALDRQDYLHYEVIVADDASEDETPEVLEPWKGERRRVVGLVTAGGSYAARNMGWEAAQGEIVAFTDDDCLPSPGWLSGLARQFELGDWTGVQGVTLAEPGEATPFTHEIKQTRPGPPYRTCNIAYRRAALAKRNGFDARLPWYADNLLGLRIGVDRIGFAPDAMVYHPPRPREWRTRRAWLERFQADALYREELLTLGNYSRAAPVRVLPFALWIVRPIVKQSWRHLSYLARHPARYVRAVRPMVGEKIELLHALRAYQSILSDKPPNGALPALPSEPLVSVVIVTHNAGEATRKQWALLGGTLEALSRQTWRRHEVIIVAHGEHHNGDALVRQIGVRVVTCGGTLAEARQAGVEAATGEVVAFTDDDCLPAPTWLEQGVKSLENDGRFWGVQGRTLAEPGPPETRAIHVDAPDRLYQTCNIAYRRDALQAVGGFDTGFDGWFEDTALGARISARGTIGWNPDMLVTHRAVPRRPFDRPTWRRLIADERRLADGYPAFYRRARGPSVLSAVVVRWLIGSPLKSLWQALPRAADDPMAYGRLAWTLLRERWALVSALREPF
jgi:glycosyltransferase involved in cell wall biosynthesis